MKCSFRTEQLYDRLSYNPDLIEIHLFDDDLFGEKRQQLENTIEMLKGLGKQVYLHHPIKYRGKYLDIISDDPQVYGYYHLSTRILADICNQHNVKCVIHPHYESSVSSTMTDENRERMIEEIKNILSYSGDVFLWENTVEGLFSGRNQEWIEKIVKPLNLPIIFDISHSFISHNGDNDKLTEDLKALAPYIQYFHVVDSIGTEHDGLSLGKGKINWGPIIPYLKGKPYIYEVLLEDMNDAEEMAISHEYLMYLAKELELL